MRSLDGRALTTQTKLTGFSLVRVAVALFCSCTGAVAQTTAQRDASALQFLMQAVQAAGGQTALAAIQDFTATGTVNQNWGVNPQQGQVTIKALGVWQFRIDSALPRGTWSFVVSDGAGEFVNPNGTKEPLPYHNVINSPYLTCPILKIITALSDQTMTVIDAGLVPFNGSQAHQVRIQQSLSSDPTGHLSKLSTQDYFFDPTTLSILQTKDFVHPDNDSRNRSFVHTVDFTNYTTVNGLNVPFSITETVDGQWHWRIQLTSIAFNSGLTTSDFSF